jgi:undecaprenyl-diphosphatase
MDLIVYLKAVILGLVEGATEFIPVSSTGHLILFQDWLNFEGEVENAFIIVIQLGAILAVLWLYREKFLDVLRNLGSPRSKRLILNLFLGTLPAVVVGLPTNEWIEERLFHPLPVAWALIVGGILILVVERRSRRAKVEDVDDIPWKLALGVGLFQLLAVLWPGFSRSGATIMGGLLLGLSRLAATEFSFFLAIPAMFGASLIKTGSILEVADAGDIGVFAVGIVVAFVSALLVIRKLIAFVSSSTFRPFAWYRIAVGIVLVAWYTLGGGA